MRTTRPLTFQTGVHTYYIQLQANRPLNQDGTPVPAVTCFDEATVVLCANRTPSMLWEDLVHEKCETLTYHYGEPVNNDQKRTQHANADAELRRDLDPQGGLRELIRRATRTRGVTPPPTCAIVSPAGGVVTASTHADVQRKAQSIGHVVAFLSVQSPEFVEDFANDLATPAPIP